MHIGLHSESSKHNKKYKIKPIGGAVYNFQNLFIGTVMYILSGY